MDSMDKTINSLYLRIHFLFLNLFKKIGYIYSNLLMGVKHDKSIMDKK
jgi:hypothetical protein